MPGELPPAWRPPALLSHMGREVTGPRTVRARTKHGTPRKSVNVQVGIVLDGEIETMDVIREHTDKRRCARAAVAVALALGALVTGARATATEIVPSVGITRSVNSGETKSFTGLALRGEAIQSLLSLEVRAAYRKQTRYDGQLTEKMLPLTASAWLTPLRVLYAGGGVGWYHTTLDYEAPSPYADQTTQEFGVHVGGGVRVPIAPAVALDLNGRYVFLEDQETALVPRKFDPDFWDTSVGLAVHF